MNMYYNKLYTLYDSPGGSLTTEGGKSTDGGGGKVDPRGGKDSKDGGGNIGTGVNTLGEMQAALKTYDTVSCPCATSLVTNNAGNDTCQRDYFGTIQAFSPTIRRNHSIDGNIPKVGDKWRCVAPEKCNDGDFTWDAFHVVKVKDGVLKTSSIVNSISSTSNCYIPVNDLDLNMSDINFEDTDTGMKNPITYIGDIPIFKEKDHAIIYDQVFSKETKHTISKYTTNDVDGYAPGEFYPTRKLITGCFVNGVDVLNYMYRNNWKHDLNDSSKGKIIIKPHGGTLRVKVLGLNKPAFDIKIKDSSKCTILDKKLKNIEVEENGTYYLNQEIPKLPSGKTSETYDFELTPNADVNYYLYGDNLNKVDGLIKVGVIKFKVYQYKNPTITFTKSDSTISGAVTSGSDVTILGMVNQYSGDVPKSSKTTHTTTITKDGESSDNYYINKKLILSDLITKSSVIKKRIIKLSDIKEVSRSTEITIGPSVNLDGNNLPIYNGDLEVGMKFQGKVEKTKVIRKSVDLDIHKEPCDDCDENIDIITNKFEVDDTGDLFSGMIATGDDFVSELQSVDCEKGITLTTEHIVKNGKSITFSYSQSGYIDKITNDNISVNPAIRLPHKTELTFENANNSKLNGSIKFDYSGAGTVILTTTIDDILFGQEDVTFTLDPNLFVTNKPNACDTHVVVGKNTTGNHFNIIECDDDYNKYSKVTTVTGGPSHGDLSLETARASGGRSVLIYAPSANFVGNDEIRFTVSDGVTSSDEKTIYIKVK